MQWWEAALWGLAGGMSVEALELYAEIHRTPKGRKWSWRRPIPQGLGAYLVSLFIRSGIGAVLAAAAAASGQVAGALGALALGVAAPLVIEKLTRLAAGQLAQNFELLPPGPAPAVPALQLPPPTADPQQLDPAAGGGSHAP